VAWCAMLTLSASVLARSPQVVPSAVGTGELRSEQEDVVLQVGRLAYTDPRPGIGAQDRVARDEDAPGDGHVAEDLDERTEVAPPFRDDRVAKGEVGVASRRKWRSVVARVRRRRNIRRSRR